MQGRLCEPTNGITASADGGRRLDGSHCGSDIWSHFLHSNIETAALFAEAMNASKDDIPRRALPLPTGCSGCVRLPSS